MEQNTIYLYSLNITFISCSKPIFWVKKFPPLPISGFRVPTYLTKKVLFFLLSLPLSVDRNKKKRKDLSNLSKFPLSEYLTNNKGLKKSIFYYS